MLLSLLALQPFKLIYFFLNDLHSDFCSLWLFGAHALCVFVVALRSVLHALIYNKYSNLHVRCHPGGCWWVWVYQKRQSASSTGRLWPESPGGSGLFPVWRGQPYPPPAKMSCGKHTCKIGTKLDTTFPLSLLLTHIQCAVFGDTRRLDKWIGKLSMFYSTYSEI